MGLDGVELVMECEDKFSITISDDDAERTETVGQLQYLCTRLIREQTSRTTLSNAEIQAIHDEVRRITAEQLGVKLHRVIPSARFIDDLGMH